MAYKLDYRFTDVEVIKDLKTLRSGRYEIIPRPTPIRPEEVDNTLQRYSNYQPENWKSFESGTVLVCRSLDEKLGILLEAKRRYLDPAQVMIQIAALTEATADAMDRTESYSRCLDLGKQYKGRYKGLHLETMCLQLPPRLAQIQGAVTKVKEKREDVYAIFMDIVRAHLPNIIQRFSKTRLARDDPWKPLNDLLYPYET